MQKKKKKGKERVRCANKRKRGEEADDGHDSEDAPCFSIYKESVQGESVKGTKNKKQKEKKRQKKKKKELDEDYKNMPWGEDQALPQGLLKLDSGEALDTKHVPIEVQDALFPLVEKLRCGVNVFGEPSFKHVSFYDANRGLKKEGKQVSPEWQIQKMVTGECVFFGRATSTRMASFIVAATYVDPRLKDRNNVYGWARWICEKGEEGERRVAEWLCDPTVRSCLDEKRYEAAMSETRGRSKGSKKTTILDEQLRLEGVTNKNTEPERTMPYDTRLCFYTSNRKEEACDLSILEDDGPEKEDPSNDEDLYSLLE